MKLDPKVQRVIKWRENLSTMKDERFFDIIRTYLGEIHTPYNKDKLIESLSAIFRKEENKKNIISFLSDCDIKILSAISFIENPTQSTITKFFAGEYNFSEIYSTLLSLTERMLIFSCKDKDFPEKQAILEINPLLEETLAPYIGISTLFSVSECVNFSTDIDFSLSPQFLASFISYVKTHSEICKNDTTIKKKNLERLVEIFSVNENCLSSLVKAFFNLEILRFGEKGIFFDEKRLQKFANLEEYKQYAYLSVAAASRLGRESLRLNTQLLLDVASAVPDEGFSRAFLKRTAFVFSSNSKKDGIDGFLQGRFARILEERSNSSNSEKKNFASDTLIDSIIDCAIDFGLFTPLGKDKDGCVIYRSVLKKIENSEIENASASKKGLLNINAGTNITIMPGFSLNELLPLVSFMNIASYNTVCEFEITRQSANRAFDAGFTPSKIFDLLFQYSAFEIPQSLKMNIEEWFNSYSSAMLFKGYVLKVDEKIVRIIENNPKISPFIQETLGQGIYLLNIPETEDVDDFIQASGLEFMGSVKTSAKTADAADFPLLRKGKNFFEDTKDGVERQDIIAFTKTASETKKQFHQKLDSLNLNQQQRDCLSSRIDRGLIISEEQLRADTVRLEILEVDGMNYAGKMRLLENAISSGNLVEIFVPSDKNPQEIISVIGKPLMLVRHPNDCLVRMQVEPDNGICFISVSSANKIKLIKTSLFR